MNRRGITLAELLIGMFVLAIIGTVVYNVYLVVGSFANSEQSRIEVDLSASRILSTVDSTLRQAKEVEGDHSFGGTTRTTGTSVLVFTLPSILLGGDISSDKVDFAALFVENGRLNFQLDPDPVSQRTASTAAVADRVKDVVFRYNTTSAESATAVTVLLQTEKAVAGSSYVQTALLQVTFRNHP